MWVHSGTLSLGLRISMLCLSADFRVPEMSIVAAEVRLDTTVEHSRRRRRVESSAVLAHRMICCVVMYCIDIQSRVTTVAAVSDIAKVQLQVAT
jgi:hypothetical protein